MPPLPGCLEPESAIALAQQDGDAVAAGIGHDPLLNSPTCRLRPDQPDAAPRSNGGAHGMNETEPLLRPKRIAIRRSANYWQPAVRQPPRATERRCEALATYVVTGGSMARTAAILGIFAEHGEAPSRRPAGTVRALDRAAHLRRAIRRVAPNPELRARRPNAQDGSTGAELTPDG